MALICYEVDSEVVLLHGHEAFIVPSKIVKACQKVLYDIILLGWCEKRKKREIYISHIERHVWESPINMKVVAQFYSCLSRPFG